MAFTTTTGAGGTSLIGTSGVDTTSVTPSSLTSAVFIGAQGDADVVNTITSTATNYTVRLGAGNDIFNSAGATSNFVTGDDGNDTLTFTGTITTSTVSGLNGVDTIAVAGVTSSTINGNNDSDAITANGALVSATIVGGQGDDSITLGAATTFAASRVNGQDGSDTITITNGMAAMAAGSTIFGGAGSDNFVNNQAAASATIISGDNGNDTIAGGAGRDSLYGGNGSDRITGGALADYMSLGSDSDTVVQNADGAVGAGAQTAVGANWAAGDTFTFANGMDQIIGFTTGTGGDVVDVATAAVPTAIFGTANGIGTALAANSVSYLSGNWNSSTGVFTVTANGIGADTFVIQTIAGAATANAATASFMLVGVNSTTLSAANFV